MFSHNNASERVQLEKEEGCVSVEEGSFLLPCMLASAFQFYFLFFYIFMSKRSAVPKRPRCCVSHRKDVYVLAIVYVLWRIG